MPMDPGDRSDVEWLLGLANKQGAAEAARNDEILTRQAKHASATVGMIAALKAFDSDADLAGLAAAAENPTSPSGSATS